MLMKLNRLGRNCGFRPDLIWNGAKSANPEPLLQRTNELRNYHPDDDIYLTKTERKVISFSSTPVKSMGSTTRYLHAPVISPAGDFSCSRSAAASAPFHGSLSLLEKCALFNQQQTLLCLSNVASIAVWLSNAYFPATWLCEMPGRKPPTNPMEDTFAGIPVAQVSKRDISISGIITTIHGLDELPTAVTEVAVLWLLHPRLERSETMAPLANMAISAWNQPCNPIRGQASKGLLAIAIDLRNHGRRQTNPLANQVWRTGNPKHAMDMVAICQGTASDVSLLMDHLPSYIFPSGKVRITQHLCCGVSLGGHVAWQLLVGEPRITTNIILLGCADLLGLLTDRARLSKLQSYAETTPPGDKFIGSRDFPDVLAAALRRIDAAQRIMGAAYGTPRREPSEAEAQQLQKCILSEGTRGKRLLVISGGADKMAPYQLTSPVMEFLQHVVGQNTRRGHHGGLVIKAVVVPNVQHELTMDMVREAVDFALESIACNGSSSSPSSSSQPACKI